MNQELQKQQSEGRVDRGMSTAQAGETYKGIDPIAPLDGVSIQPTMIQFDYRVYQDEQELWRKTAKRVEDLFRSEAGKCDQLRGQIESLKLAIETQRDQAHKVGVALTSGGIKLVRMRNGAFRAVILKRKPKKK